MTKPRRTLIALLALALIAALPLATRSAAPAAAQEPAAAEPLVADAGASSFVQSGEFVTLLGTGYGGSEPYSFTWTSDGGEVVRAGEPGAQVATDGLAGGTYTAQLVVTDAAGATASDTVRFVVAGTPEAQTLLESTAADTTPGVTGGPTGNYEIPFEVPAGLARIDVDLTWTNVANDYDLEVVDPSGAVQASSGNSPPSFEAAGVPAPAEGTWTVRAVRFATSTDLGVTAVVTGLGGAAEGGDSRPVIDAGGPYRFVDGAPQALAGSVVGGSAPVQVGWDLDLDGVVDVDGATPAVDLPDGRHLVVLHAQDAAGLESQQMTSVLVGSAERVLDETVPITVIGLADSGINPYHEELSAATYPDPEVLELTQNFTRHPSEYIPGYPADAKPLPITLGAGYYPEQDTQLWDGNTYLQSGELYWIPGTKIVGALDAGGSTGATSGEDIHPILDDNGHGTGSSTVSTGNRYGYCPTCLLVNVEALDESVVAKYDWIDISTNSFGYIGGLPIGYVVGPNEITRAAAERGQTTLFAAGNGVGNAFDVPISTYGSDQTGPDWNITVGALREDTQGAVVGDGIPAHVSALGDGDLPSACRVGVNAQCAFGGTSAATPYTAGAFGQTLTNVRAALGDHSRPGQLPGQVVAQGTPIPDSPFLADGVLTREELRAAVLKTATPNFEGSSTFLYPANYNGEESRVVVEGYGAANPNSATRATAVLLGELPLPARPEEDAFFAEDCALRDEQYGSYDRNGDGEPDGCEASGTLALTGEGVPTNDPAPPGTDAYAPARDAIDQPYGDQTPSTLFLHRILDIEPDRREPAEETEDGEPEDAEPQTQGSCNGNDNSQFMDGVDFEFDNEPCFDQVVTGFVAGFRPKGIFAASDIVRSPLPAGSTVLAEVYLASLESGPVQISGVLNATDRTVGESAAATGAVTPSGDPEACSALGEACWTRFDLELTTERPVAAGEQLTFQVNILRGASNFAFGHEGEHVSKLTVTPAPLPETGLEFGAGIDASTPTSSPDGTLALSGPVAFPDLGLDPQLAGFHPTVEKVEVAVDDPDFSDPTYAVVDRTAGTWAVELDGLEPGERTVQVRALRDRFPSPVASTSVQVTGVPGGPGTGPGPVPGALEVERVFGPGRIDTAIELSQRGFDSADAVVLARADQFPDALTAATLAAEVDGPVLLTPVNSLAPAVEAEIDRLGATTVYLAGGPEALDETVETAAGSDGRTTVRLAGIDRFETAALIADEVVDLGGPVTQAILARAEQFADALAAGNLATAARTPILLAAPDDLNATTSSALDSLLDAGATVYLAGGTAALDDSVEAAVTDAGYTPARRFGAERYATAAALVREAIAQGATANPTILASGANFPDALAAVPVSHALGGVTVLVDPNSLDASPATAQLLSDNAAAIRTLLIAGGVEAISDTVRDDVIALLTGPAG